MLLTVAALALRAFHMSTQSLWFDEIASAHVAVTPVAEQLRGIHAGDGSVDPTAWISTAYYALLKIVLLIPHSSPDWLLRATSVALGTATVPAMAWATLGFLPRNAALVATAALAVSPFHVWYSQEVRAYVLVVFLSTLLLGALMRALQANRTSSWVAVALLVTAALYTHPIALALPVICGLGVLITGVSHPRTSLKGLAALVAAGIAFLPGALWIRALGANNPADARGVGLFDLAYAFYAYAVGFSFGPSTADLHAGTLAPVMPYLPLIAFAAAIFGGLTLYGILALRRLPSNSSLLVAAWLVVPLTLAITIAVASGNPFNVRYSIVSFPAFVVLMGIGAADARRPLVGLLAAAALALSFVSLRNLYFDPYYAKEDCRALAAALRTEAAPDDLILVNAGYMSQAVSYFYPGPATVVGYPAPAQESGRPLDPATTASDVARLMAGRNHGWLIASRTFHGDRAGTLQKTLSEMGVNDRTLHFAGIEAYHYTFRPTS